MAGHNKWSKVKHIKAVVDVRRGKVFSKHSKEITLAAKEGGGNSDLNARLRAAIIAARAQNMPNDKIDRAVKKGTGELEGAELVEIVYEGYGPGGVAMLVEVVTDNRNRSAQDMRTLFSKNEGTFADAGSVAYLFSRRGEVRIPRGGIDEEAATELAMDAGAEDVLDGGDEWIYYTDMGQLFPVGSALRDKGHEPNSQKLIYHPATTVTITDVEAGVRLLKLYEALDDYDDTQNVYANFEISDDIADELAAMTA